MVKKANTSRCLALYIGIVLTIGAAYTLPACSTATGTKDAVMTESEAVLVARRAWESMYEKLNGRNPVYGKEATSKFEPYAAKLVDGSWVVRGTIPPGFHGQTIETRIRQENGSVSLTVVEIE